MTYVLYFMGCIVLLMAFLALVSAFVLLILTLWDMIKDDHEEIYQLVRKLIGHPVKEPEPKPDFTRDDLIRIRYVRDKMNENNKGKDNEA